MDLPSIILLAHGIHKQFNKFTPYPIGFGYNFQIVARIIVVWLKLKSRHLLKKYSRHQHQPSKSLS